MNILAIETSCDETAVTVMEALGDFPHAKYEVLGNALFSQIETHREYGGVFPMMAKREHAATLVPMLEKALTEAQLPHVRDKGFFDEQQEHVANILEREEGLAEQLLTFYKKYDTPSIGLIAVTAGPGLEPALWVGVSFAKALSYMWNVPVVAVNHMEGHVLASIFNGQTLAPLQFPALSLLVSGGHTELILMKNWGHYEKIGQTRDDAVGEAFDKVARLLGIPYPGGPEVSRRASIARATGLPVFTKFPRPMLDSGDLDFSFSGLKTAVRYAIAGKTLSEDEISAVARDFEDAAIDVLVKKTTKAVESLGIKSVIIGGGVSANQYLRARLTESIKNEYHGTTLYLPDVQLSTDNSIMIALAGHAQAKKALTAEAVDTISANGHRSITEESL